MSGIIQKAKEVVHDVTHKDKTSSTTTTGTHGSTNAGPHNTNMANAADPRVDSNLDGGHHAGMNQTTHTTGQPITTGTHTAGTTGVGGTTHGSTNAGPHNSNVANKVDPRVDSDLDGSRNAGMNQTTHTGGHIGTTGTHHAGTHHTSHTAGTTGVGGTTHGSTTTAGPHSTNIANKLDPRVDSDLDGSKNMGLNKTTHSTGHHTTTGTTGTTGIGGTTHGSTNAGPHNSNAMNAMDPRVDSDLDGSRNMGMNQTTRAGTHGTSHTGTTGIGGTTHGSTNAGPHSSNAMNKMDPRVDSDLDGGRHAGLNQTTHPTTGNPAMTGTHNTTGHSATSGSNTTTAGPHKSDLMNKLDPRVDSDLDGSKNMGMNKTTNTTNTNTTY